MSLAALSVLPVRLTRVTFSLFVLALASLLLPATARAQTTYSGGSASFTTSSPATGATSTITVSGAPGTVSTVEVQLLGVKSTSAEYETGPYANEASYDSLGYAEFLLVGPGGAQLVLLYQTGSGIDGCDENQNPVPSCDGLQGSTSGSHPDTITIVDGAHSAPNGAGSLGEQYEGWQTAYMPYTVAPSSYSNYDGDFPPPLPTAVNTADYPQSDGSATLNGRFGGTQANGTWTLYLIDNDPYPGVDPFSITGWNLILTFSAATPTTTTLSSSANPASYPNSATSGSVTFTATVTSSSGTPTGTVTFQANGSTISGCGAVALSGGVAPCTVSLAQGNNSIAAQYTPSGSFGQSSTSMTQLMEVTAENTSGYTWCNNSLIADPINGNPGLAYPSVIKIPSGTYSKSVANVTVELENVQGTTNGISGQFLLVAPGGGAQNLDFFDSGFSQPGGATSEVNLTFEDTASGYVPISTPAASGTFLPTDDNEGVNPDYFPTSTSPSIDSNIPQVPSKVNFALPYGQDNNDYKPYTNIYTFGEAFNGATANGDWALYSTVGEGANVNSGWCITFTFNSGSATTTAVTSGGNNPATTGQPVTFTATVTSGGNPVTSGGTVTFLDNNAAPAGTVSGNNVVTLNGSGVATFTTSSLTEGDHTITANYSGTSSDNASFSTVLHQRINTATTVTQVSSNEWQYCDPGKVQGITTDPAGPLTPNPSVITVTNLPGALNSVAVQLTNFSVPGAENLDQLETLVEGPTGAALDFFSNTTQGSSGNSTASAGNYIFEDSASAQVSSGNVNLSPGSYKPTAYEDFLDAADRFTSSTSGFYPAPTTFSYAGPTSFGSDSTFADVFTNGSNANGTWSLFFNTGQSSPQSTMGAAGGWCVNLTENLPTVSVTTSPSTSTFTQGQTGTFTVSVTNNGPGNTGDPTGVNPMTVIDTLGAAFTYSSYSGTNWSCAASGQTVTCTNDTANAEGGYPELTINVSVPGNSGNGNSVSASGAGATNTATASTSVTIDMPPAFTSAASTTFTVGTAGSFTVTASGNPAPSFTETGALPTGVTLTTAGLLSGTPAAGTGGSYPITITAGNGTTNGTQNFTLTVDQAPAITSAASTTFTVGTAGSFTVTASGNPASTFTESGALPSGVTLTTAGLLSGTPAAGTGGSYPITITASNGVIPAATQSFTLTVDQAPAITSASGATFSGRTPDSFTVTASGFPAAMTFSETGALPSGITFSTAGTLSGTLANGTDGSYPITITASNGVNPVGTQSFTLNVINAGTPIPAALATPTANATLAGSSQNFTWNPAAGATGYTLWLGSSAGSGNLFDASTTATTITANNLPVNGETIYARLITNFNGVYVYTDSTYTAVLPASLSSPAANATLAGSSQSFTWNPVAGATGYTLLLGSSAGSGNLFDASTTTTTITANNLPVNGETIYARLITDFNGGVYSYTNTTFTADLPATLSSPSANATLAGFGQSFTWNPVAGATGYTLWLGSSAGSGNLFDASTTATTITANNLPSNGETIYARLITNFNGGVYAYTNTTFTAVLPATLATPTANATLAGSSQNFTWNPVPGATGYVLFLGSSVGSGNLLDAHTTATNYTANNLPVNGETIYARLFTNFNGVYAYTDTSFTAK